MKISLPSGETFDIRDVSISRGYSILLTELREMSEEDETIRVDIHEKTKLVGKVVEYLNHLAEYPPTKFPKAGFVFIEDWASTWEQEFLSALPFAELQELAEVTEFFKIDNLLNLVMVKIANEIYRNMEVQESETLGLSAAEKAYLRRRLAKYEKEKTMKSTVVKES